MLEAIIIIIALGGLEIALWYADHKRQRDQLETLEAIWVELALLNEGTARAHLSGSGELPGVKAVETITIPLAADEPVVSAHRVPDLMAQVGPAIVAPAVSPVGQMAAR